ncbi:MAG: hypothetical protein Q7R97_00300 [Candidatus Daviesbacteria bacterium]|nr:hypothetical protein [Candidatus Daviesbacteria bacterium]
MDTANKKNPLQPGSDSKVHDQTLQQGVADNLSVDPSTVAPSDQEESFAEKVGEDLQALNPFNPSTVRYAPNTDKKKGGFLNLLLGRIKRQHPDDNIKEKA